MKVLRVAVFSTAVLAMAACAPFSGTEARRPSMPVGEAAAMLTLAAEPFLVSCRASLSDARAEMEQLKAAAGRDPIRVIGLFDDARKTLDDAGSRAGLAAEVHPDRATREAAETCGREVSALSTEFSLDRGVYDALFRIEARGLDGPSRYYLKRTLQEFRLAGVDRDDATRERVKKINEDLTRLSQEFGRNIREGVLTLEVDPMDLAGLPADFIQAHVPNAKGKVVLKTDNQDYRPVVAYASNAQVREKFWKLYRLQAHPGNLPVLDQILARRHELATLLGFANWADYVTVDKMIGSGQKAADFIEKISAAAARRSERDYALLLERKRRDEPGATRVQPWDSDYLTERIKAEQFGVDAVAVRPYFQYDNVKKAVLETTSRLFNIRYQRVNEARVWHPEVEVYDVYEGSRKLGRIYLDMHPRDNKYKHYAHFGLVRGKAGVALPEGVLVCNFRKPTADDPGLLEYSDAVTFFHEFGHLLHNVFGGHTRWAGISGVATERDFVEAPSQMLEEWVRDPSTLRGIATHYQTGQPMPMAVAQKLRRAADFGTGLFVRQQMFYAATSLGLHSRDPKGLDTTSFVGEQQSRYTPFAYVPGTYFHASFGHLDGYSAVYYTYMWSLVIAKDMFSVFQGQGDIMNPSVALNYRNAVLAPGGSKPAAELVQDFLGRAYSFKAYEDWLNSN